ncbi:MAG: ATP-binding cassette domain-containing protein [bacterium]|nr:ATP-binding cassette domain-containing protein [bacterium]
MNLPIIECNHLTFSYGDEPVLDGVTLTVQAGDFASIVGPNGGGKTTLLKLILGLLKPDRGEIRVFGHPPQEVSQRIGYVPQHIQYDPLFPISVKEVVLTARIGNQVMGRYTRADHEAAEAAIEEMALEDSASSLFSSLSGGQRQRVLIARALCSHPELLLMDEPTANIDKVVQKKLFDILLDLNKRMTILLISHDLGFVSSFVNTVICVNRTVHIHPTQSVTGEIIQDLYEREVQIIHHGHTI